MFKIYYFKKGSILLDILYLKNFNIEFLNILFLIGYILKKCKLIKKNLIRIKIN